MSIRFLFVLVGLLFSAASLRAQDIVVTTQSPCKISVQLESRAISAGSPVPLPLSQNRGFTIRLNNAANRRDLIIALINADVNIPLDSAFFRANQPISFDAQFKATFGQQVLDLTKEFKLVAGCSSLESSMVEIKFQPSVAPDPGPGPGPRIVTNNPTGGGGGAPQEQPYTPGSAVYDALKLSDNEDLRPSEFLKIVQFYYSDTVNDLAKAQTAVRSNPMLKDLGFNPLKAELGAARAGGSLLGGLSLSSIGGLDVTAISDGIARFLAQRVKEELNALFFQKLKETLEKNEYRDLRTLFPGTYQLLQAMGDEIYNYEKYIQNLREAFKNDINVLDENLPGIIDNHPAFFTTHHEMAAILRSGCYVAGELKRQVHPGDILQNYPIEFLENENQAITGAIQSLQLLSASMRDTTGTDSTYWVSIKYVRQLVNNKRALQIYLGLVYQMAQRNYAGVKFSGTDSITGWITRLAPRFSDFYDPYKRFVLQFAERTETLNKMIRDYQKPATDSLALEQYKKYFDATVDLIRQASEVGKLPGPDRIDFLAALPALLAPYFQVQQDVSDLVIEVNRKNYSAAINDVVEIYQFVKTQRRRHELRDAQNLLVAVNNKQAPAGSPSADDLKTKIKELQDSVTVDNSVLMTLAKYGSFISTVATAKTSAEVQAALESFALPAGSARIKRRSAFNVSLNGYAGLFGGHENIKGTNNKALNSFGVAAPVGIAISIGQPTAKRAFSNTLFLSLIDVGALTAFRFGDDSTESVPTVRLKNILSPGIFYSLGLPNSPISLNLGYQVGPLLRTVKTTGNTVAEDRYTRVSLSVVVDIPIFNFFTKSF
jgi:hypothetical protein